MKHEKEPMTRGLAKHLILKGLTFNAENPADPVVLRPVKVDELIDAVVEYIERGDLPSRIK
jgi:hypothetical protein